MMIDFICFCRFAPKPLCSYLSGCFIVLLLQRARRVFGLALNFSTFYPSLRSKCFSGHSGAFTVAELFSEWVRITVSIVRRERSKCEALSKKGERTNGATLFIETG
jgi:hypothetical protein